MVWRPERALWGDVTGPSLLFLSVAQLWSSNALLFVLVIFSMFVFFFSRILDLWSTPFQQFYLSFLFLSLAAVQYKIWNMPFHSSSMLLYISSSASGQVMYLGIVDLGWTMGSEGYYRGDYRGIESGLQLTCCAASDLGFRPETLNPLSFSEAEAITPLSLTHDFSSIPMATLVPRNRQQN